MNKRRKTSSVHLYHVTSRGVGGQIIFEDDADRRHFLALLKYVIDSYNVRLAAWCLMDNHIHLIARADLAELAAAMRYLIGRYAFDANKRYGRSGHLFQGKFSSYPIEDESYLAAAVQYVHFNPVRAGIVSAPSAYPWSSAREYMGELFLLDKSLMLELPEEPPNPAAALSLLYREAKLSDDRAAAAICSLICVDSPTEIKSFPRDRRNSAIRAIVDMGIGVRQLSRLTGIAASLISNIANNPNNSEQKEQK